MVAIPIAILALAAGIYLLTYVKQFSLGGLYKYLSWLVILLSLAFIIGSVARGAIHMRHMHEIGMQGRHDGAACCPYMKGPGNMGGSCCDMHGQMGGMGAACCADMKGGADMKDCCKDMKGDAGTCSEMKGTGNKMPCCQKGAAADSAAKK